MRRELIEFMRKFKQDILDLEMKVLFLSEGDFERMREYIEEFRNVLEKHQKEALKLEEKIKEKQKMLKKL
jgi:peptidase E